MPRRGRVLVDLLVQVFSEEEEVEVEWQQEHPKAPSRSLSYCCLLRRPRRSRVVVDLLV